MQTALTFVAILTMAMLLLCGTRPAFIFLTVLAVVSAVCRIMDSFILRKRTDEKNAKDAVLQKKIANWRKVRRRQLRSNADSDDMRNGIIEDDNLPFEVVHDKEIMDFIQQYQADIQYVIFVSKRVVKILKTSSIPDILTEKNYQNFATLPVIGLTIKYGGGGSISF